MVSQEAHHMAAEGPRWGRITPPGIEPGQGESLHELSVIAFGAGPSVYLVGNTLLPEGHMTRPILVALLIFFISAGYAIAGAEPPLENAGHSRPFVACHDRYVKLTLLSTNDVHCRLLPISQTDKIANGLPQTETLGGAARQSGYASRVRAESNWPVLLLDSGDTTYWWNAMTNAFHGLADIDAMNNMGYIAMEPGNHDFEWHWDKLVSNFKASKFPWICANLVDEKTGKLYFTPYIIREYGGVKIAFFGLITQTVNEPAYNAARELGLRTTDPIEVARKLVPELRKQADIVVLLSHLGVYQDPDLAKAVPGIDVILGGHSHARLKTPTMIPVGTPTATSLGAVPMVQAGCYGGEMGRTDVIFHRDPTTGAYTLMSCKGRLILLDSSVPEDSAIVKLAESWRARLHALPAPAPTAPGPAPVSAPAPSSKP